MTFYLLMVLKVVGTVSVGHVLMIHYGYGWKFRRTASTVAHQFLKGNNILQIHLVLKLPTVQLKATYFLPPESTRCQQVYDSRFCNKLLPRALTTRLLRWPHAMPKKRKGIFPKNCLPFTARFLCSSESPQSGKARPKQDVRQGKVGQGSDMNARQSSGCAVGNIMLRSSSSKKQGLNGILI